MLLPIVAYIGVFVVSFHLRRRLAAMNVWQALVWSPPAMVEPEWERGYCVNRTILTHYPNWDTSREWKGMLLTSTLGQLQ